MLLVENELSWSFTRSWTGRNRSHEQIWKSCLGFLRKEQTAARLWGQTKKKRKRLFGLEGTGDGSLCPHDPPCVRSNCIRVHVSLCLRRRSVFIFLKDVSLLVQVASSALTELGHSRLGSCWGHMCTTVPPAHPVGCLGLLGLQHIWWRFNMWMAVKRRKVVTFL